MTVAYASATAEVLATQVRPTDEPRRYQVAPLSVIDEGTYFLVGDPATNEFYQFPAVAVEIVSLLREGWSDHEITEHLHRRGDVVDVADLIDTLSSLSMVRVSVDGGEAPSVAAEPQPSGAFATAVLLGKALFSPVGWIIYLLVLASAAIAVVNRPDLLPSVSALAFNDHLTATMIALLVLHGGAVAIHEACHMLAAARHGVRTELGFGNRLWSIVAEADLSGILALPRRRRYLPLAAGMVADFFVVAACTLALAYLFDPGSTTIGATLLRALILQILLTVGWQFNFYLRTDVYYLLCTYARQPRLDTDAQEYRSALAYRLSGGLLGRAPRRREPVSAMVRFFALLWAVGRLIAIGALCFIFIPTVAHYIILAVRTFNDPTAGTYRKLDTVMFVACVVSLMGVGMAMWLMSTVRAYRKDD